MSKVEGLSPQGAVMMGMITAMVMVLGFGVWAAMVPIEGAVIANGEVDDTTYRHVIQHPLGGSISELAVREGEQVEAGDLLFKLHDLPLEAEWSLITAQLVDAQARNLRLIAERDGIEMQIDPNQLLLDPSMEAAIDAQIRLFDARALTLNRQLAQLDQRESQAEDQLEGLQAQLDAVEREVALLAIEIETQVELRDRGLTQASRVAGLSREAARLDGSRAAIVAQMTEVRGQIVEIGLQAGALLAARREEAEQFLVENSARLLELESRRAILSDRRSQMVLLSPVSGRVHGMLELERGSVLRPAETALQIVERPDRPVLALRISPADIDHVHVGQRAQLQFPALMPEVGSLSATVTAISAAPFLDERTGARHYRAEATLTQDALDAVGAKVLLPGLSVQAFLRTGARTPLAYLLSPITQHLAGALREP